MNTLQNTHKTKFGKIFIEEKTRHSDGSVTLNYSLDNDALIECAKELDKDFKKLTEDEIHTFVVKNISHALKGINGWRAEKNTLIPEDLPIE
jgi:hypothetical protein